MTGKEIYEERVAIARRLLEPDIGAIARATGLRAEEVEHLYQHQIGVIEGRIIGKFETIVNIAQSKVSNDLLRRLKNSMRITNWEWEAAQEFLKPFDFDEEMKDNDDTY